jgi:hypothetical protein
MEAVDSEDGKLWKKAMVEEMTALSHWQQMSV